MESNNDIPLLQQVKQGTLDFAFALLPLDSQTFAYRELVLDEFVLVSKRGGSLPTRIDSHDQLHGLPLIVYRTCRSATALVAFLDGQLGEPNIVFRSDDNAAIEEMVRAGLGVAILPRLWTSLGTNEGVELTSLTGIVPPRVVVLAWRADRTLTPAQQAFVDVAAASVRELAPHASPVNSEPRHPGKKAEPFEESPPGRMKTCLAVMRVSVCRCRLLGRELRRHRDRPRVVSSAPFRCSALWVGRPAGRVFRARHQMRRTVVVAVGLFICVGQFGLLFFVAMNIGLPAGLASVIAPLQPLFTIPFAVVALGERPSARQIAGVCVALAGLIVIAAGRAHAVPFVAVALGVTSAALWGAGNVVTRSAGTKRPFSLLVWSSLVGPVPLLGLSLIFEGMGAGSARPRRWMRPESCRSRTS